MILGPIRQSFRRACWFSPRPVVVERRHDLSISPSEKPDDEPLAQEPYDHATDPHETVNLAKEHPEIAEDPLFRLEESR